MHAWEYGAALVGAGFIDVAKGDGCTGVNDEAAMALTSRSAPNCSGVGELSVIPEIVSYRTNCTLGSV
jgi:hypothetical protein